MRITFWILFLTLLAASLIAWQLAGNDHDQARTRLVWVSDDNPVRREQIDIFNHLHPDLLLTLDPGNIRMEKIITQSIAGTGPDLFDSIGRYTLYAFVEAGIALDLTDLADEYQIDLGKTWPAIADELRIEGRQYSFPCNVVAPVLFYNKAIFDRKGLPYPPDDWTWDQFVRTASKLVRKSNDGRGYEYKNKTFAVMGLHWYELVLQAGGRMYSPDGTRCVLDSPQAQQAVQFYYDLMYRHHVMPTPDQELTMQRRGGWAPGFLKWFGAERVAMVRGGREALITLRKYKNLRGKIGICHLPHKTRKVSLVYSRSSAINRHSSKKDQALQFLKFLTGEPYNLQIVRSADGLPPLPAYVERSEFLADPSYPEEDFHQLFRQAVKRGAVGEISPLISPWTANKLMIEQLDYMTSGTKSPAQTCRDMARAVNHRIHQNLRRYEKFRKRYRRITGKTFDQSKIDK